MRAIDARIRVVGSDAVRMTTDRFAELSTRFFAQLFMAQLAQRAVPEDQADSAKAIAARMALGKIADQMNGLVRELEAAIRVELKR